jgi:GT2 family glycosyltransferase
LASAKRALDAAAAWLLLFGLAAIATRQARRWRADRALARVVQSRGSQPIPPLPKGPLVSTLVAAWNEAELIERHLESVLQLRYPNREYLLCAGGQDGTYQIAGRSVRPGLVVLEQQPGEGKQAALRRCLAQANGEIIFLTDADCLLDDQSFERTLEPLLRDQAEAASGGARPLDEQVDGHDKVDGRAGANPLLLSRWAADAYLEAHLPSERDGLRGANAALTRSALRRAGDLAAEVRSGTDYHLARMLQRAGIPIRSVPDSALRTRYPASLADAARRQRRWLRNVVRLGLQYGAAAEARAARRTCLLACAVLGLPLAAPLVGRLALVLCLLALVEGSLAKGRYLRFLALTAAPPRPRLTARLALALPLVTLAELGIAAAAAPACLLGRGETEW